MSDPSRQITQLRPHALAQIANHFTLRKVKRSLLGISVVSLAVFFIVILLFPHFMRQSVGWKYFYEVITGNWGPDQPAQSLRKRKPYISDQEYAVGLIGAILINYGPYVTVLGFTLKILRDRGNRVINLKQAMSVREEVTKDFLTDIFSEVMSPEEVNKNIATAYEHMERRWEDRLRRMIGPGGVQQVLKDLERPIEPS